MSYENIGYFYSYKAISGAEGKEGVFLLEDVMTSAMDSNSRVAMLMFYEDLGAEMRGEGEKRYWDEDEIELFKEENRVKFLTSMNSD